MSSPPPAPRPRRIRTAELVAVGSELTAGETQDTNGGELAGSLAACGVGVRRITDLPDDLGLVTAAFRDALGAVDLVVATGGLGPTPDDLTREALAAAVGETPQVDADLEAWLRAIFVRRGIPLPAVNLKQAWTIPSATSIPNPNGTAPGWWVDRPDGRVAVLLPGPPREMRPMWSGWVVPRLRERGVGDGRVVRTLRTYGIGESSVAEVLGEDMLRRSNPVVATYARADWLDVRISAIDEALPGGTVRPGAAILEEAVARVEALLAGHVRAEGQTSWADLVAAAATRAGVEMAVVEAGTRGALGALLADVPALRQATSFGPDVASAALAERLVDAAGDAARGAGVAIGVAVAAWDDAGQTQVRAAIAAPAAGWSRTTEVRLFQHGQHGRFRAAVAAAAFLAEVLGER